MTRLSTIIKEAVNKKINEAEAPEEELSLDEEPVEETPVEGTEEVEEPLEDEEEPLEDEEEPLEIDDTLDVEDIENPDDILDKTIVEMVGITELQHTSSSTIVDFEDGGQIMYVHPMVSLKSETLNSIIDLIIADVKKTYSVSTDEITGKTLNKTKYWKSISTLISTMVRSQLTKSDNLNGLIDEIKQVFKILEVK